MSSSQTEILQNIMDLYNAGNPFHADLTYGKGNFWKHLPRPFIRMDLLPTGNVVGDVRDLPFQKNSLGSVVFDPPFLHAAHGRMGAQFGSLPSQAAIHELYIQALTEIRYCLAPGGLLVFKCQDCIESGKQHFNHCYIEGWARTRGFRAEDLFILTRNSVMIGWNHHQQKHARKNHCYFFVFRKGK